MGTPWPPATPEAPPCAIVGHGVAAPRTGHTREVDDDPDSGGHLQPPSRDPPLFPPVSPLCGPRRQTASPRPRPWPLDPTRQSRHLTARAFILALLILAPPFLIQG